MHISTSIRESIQKNLTLSRRLHRKGTNLNLIREKREACVIEFFCARGSGKILTSKKRSFSMYCLSGIIAFDGTLKNR